MLDVAQAIPTIGYHKWSQINDSFQFHDYASHLPADALSLQSNFSDRFHVIKDFKKEFEASDQCFQQATVLQILDYKPNGFFIDLAANAWEHLSNTYALERYYNWSGICIEPNQKYWPGFFSFNS